ncbi:MAG: hypothetical protein ACOYOQ_00470 [Microthrixaceae bacterium]
MKHLAGKPVSYTTYTYHKCRCDGCREDHRVKQREFRQRGRTKLHVKADSIAHNRAAVEFKRRFPRLWRQMREEAQREVGLLDD